MGEISIRVKNLGKNYRIANLDNRRATPTLREDIINLVKTPFQAKPGANKKTIWALGDVSFEIMQGEVLGIIGRNGSGKSTLLKILAGITKPTTGFAEIFGRTGCLLEVGTGFHTELTGRDNIFISGNILGMSRAEVKNKFDEIVAFSEIEQFIDTPVKRYSSGMKVRLGFSVAAFLEPEILLIDEVLAVGDASFRKKSQDKMKEITKEGRTVLFVSHNMSSIKFLCDQTMILNDGNVKFIGSTNDAVNIYLAGQVSSIRTACVDLSVTEKRQSKYWSIFQSICLKDNIQRDTAIFNPLSDITFEICLHSNTEPINKQDIHIEILDNQNNRMAILKSFSMIGKGIDIEGRLKLTVTWKKCPLASGVYTVNLLTKGIQHNYVVDLIYGAINFQIEPLDPADIDSRNMYPGVIIPDGVWKVERDR